MFAATDRSLEWVLYHGFERTDKLYLPLQGNMSSHSNSTPVAPSLAERPRTLFRYLEELLSGQDGLFYGEEHTQERKMTPFVLWEIPIVENYRQPPETPVGGLPTNINRDRVGI